MGIFLLIALLNSPTSMGEAQNMCGRDYGNLQQLDHRLQADRNVLHFPNRDGVTTYFDQKAKTLWWLRLRKGTVIVASCRRKLATDKGFVDGQVEADCNGDQTGLCATQAQQMAQVKF